MKPNPQGRVTKDRDPGQTRIFYGPNKTVLHFEPGREAVTLEWTTAGLAVKAILALLERELSHNRPKRGQLFFKPEVEYHHRDWLGVWKKFKKTVVTDPDRIQYVRFDFTDWSIALTSLPTHHTLGISYRIYRQPGERPRPADVQAMRNVFLATADPSLKLEELDWAIESIIT